MSGLAVLGAGAFGTALAVALAADGTPVTLWARDAAHAAGIARARENARRLPGAPLPDAVTVTADLPAALAAETVLLALPMQALGPFLADHAAALDGKALVACCKGVDLATGLGPTGLMARHCPSATAAVLTGPSFAVDIAAGLPTALTLATAEADRGARLQAALARPALRLYLSADPVGAELGGALKNVVALAAGLTMGAGLGESARAAVVTRGFAEMQRFAAAFGARPETLGGLSGLGDLVLTCTSPKSRNYAAGLALARGEPLPEGRTIEGLATARAVSNLARSRGIDVPLAAMVDAVVSGRLTLEEAREALLARPLKKE